VSYLDKKYLLDGDPASAKDIIDLACKLDYEFSDEWLKRTSQAARILRTYSYTVEDNLDWEKK